MGDFHVLTILLGLSGIFGYINYRYLKFPPSVGVMVIGLIVSLLLLVTRSATNFPVERIITELSQIDFSKTVFDTLLGFLLFAGSLQIDVRNLIKEKWSIFLFSTFSVLLSTFFIGSIIYFILHIITIPISYLYALTLGALISPTDPVVVLGILKKVSLPKSLETNLIGESLFNDATCLVIFSLLSQMAISNQSFQIDKIILMLGQEVLGGVIVGLISGLIMCSLLKKVDDLHVQILITLGFVAMGYDIARIIHASGPLAVVLAGLIVGTYIRTKGYTQKEKAIQTSQLCFFWEIIDEFLNSFFFIMVSLEILTINFSFLKIVATLLSIFAMILGRYLSLYPVTFVFSKILKTLPANSLKILTWGGLRGGISMAMALILPVNETTKTILCITYGLVVFSILCQGFTLGKLLKNTDFNELELSQKA